MASYIGDTMETLQEQQQGTEQKGVTEQIDFKMVTFSLAGKEYGIDIMKVKEISKGLSSILCK